MKLPLQEVVMGSIRYCVWMSVRGVVQGKVVSVNSAIDLQGTVVWRNVSDSIVHTVLIPVIEHVKEISVQIKRKTH